MAHGVGAFAKHSPLPPISLHGAELDAMTKEAASDDAGPVVDPELLRSRIEQQSDLIMLLKTRNEELTDTVNSLNGRVAKSGADSAVLENVKAKAKIQYDVLYDRFNTLAKQHEQLIEFNAGHKADKLRFKQERDELEGKVNTIASTLKQDFKATESTLQAAIDGYKRKIASLEQQLSEESKGSDQKSDALTTKINELTARLNESAAATAAAIRERDVLQKKLDLASGDSAQLLEATEKALRDTQNTALGLSKQLEGMEGELGRNEERTAAAVAEAAELRKQAAAAAADSQDLAERMTRDPAQQQLDKLKNEYAAYKSYSADLLEKEKAMNKRLRNLNFS